MTTPVIQIDDDNYPVEASLRELVTSGHRFDEVLAAAGTYLDATYGQHRVKMISDGTDLVEVHELVTGGWSGCEEVVHVLSGTLGWTLSWESSHRGGLHVLHVKPVAAGTSTTYSTTLDD